jgi:hypothetical protein
MVTADDIRHLRTASDDYESTEELKAELTKRWQGHDPFFLNKADFDSIFEWKLRGQYSRQALSGLRLVR